MPFTWSLRETLIELHGEDDPCESWTFRNQRVLTCFRPIPPTHWCHDLHGNDLVRTVTAYCIRDLVITVTWLYLFESRPEGWKARLGSLTPWSPGPGRKEELFELRRLMMHALLVYRWDSSIMKLRSAAAYCFLYFASRRKKKKTMHMDLTRPGYANIRS
jgi:hypothetical protein